MRVSTPLVDVVICVRDFTIVVWFGLVWFGLVWFGLVWFGLVWFGTSPSHAGGAQVPAVSDSRGATRGGPAERGAQAPSPDASRLDDASASLTPSEAGTPASDVGVSMSVGYDDDQAGHGGEDTSMPPPPRPRADDGGPARHCDGEIEELRAAHADLVRLGETHLEELENVVNGAQWSEARECRSGIWCHWGVVVQI